MLLISSNLSIYKESYLKITLFSPSTPQNFQNSLPSNANKKASVSWDGQERLTKLDEPLRTSLTEYFRVLIIERIDEITNVVAFLSYKHIVQFRIESHTEYCHLSDTKHSEQFNVFGVPNQDLSKRRNISLK